jgi:hypothetical protein
MARQQQIDVVLVSEPNVRMTKNKRGWITDCEGRTAIMNRPTKLGATQHGSGKGFTCLRTRTLTVSSCYITLNCTQADFDE